MQPRSKIGESRLQEPVTADHAPLVPHVAVGLPTKPVVHVAVQVAPTAALLHEAGKVPFAMLVGSPAHVTEDCLTHLTSLPEPSTAM